jgi:hypothetical protein
MHISSSTDDQGDLLGHDEYRSQNLIRAYEKWTIASIDAIIERIEMEGKP